MQKNICVPDILLSCAVISPLLNLSEYKDFLSLRTEHVWCLHCPVSGFTEYCGKIFQPSVATIFKASRTKASSFSDIKKGREILQKPGLSGSLCIGTSGDFTTLSLRTLAISFCLKGKPFLMFVWSIKIECYYSFSFCSKY